MLNDDTRHQDNIALHTPEPLAANKSQRNVNKGGLLFPS